MISLISLPRADSKRFPTSIDILIEHDLEKLEEEKREVLEDDGDGDWQDEASDEEEGSVEASEESVASGEPKEPEGDEEKAEGDAESEIEGPDGPSSEDEDEEPRDYFDDEDSDPLTLGVRIYTKGGVVESVTGHVINDDQDKDKKVTKKQEGKTKKEVKAKTEDKTEEEG